MSWIDTAAITVGQRPLSGADRLLTLLSPSHGRLRVVARSVCLPKGPLGSALEPFGVSRVILSSSRTEGLYRVDAADRVSTMGTVRADLRRMAAAGLVCAWVRDLARREDALAQYRLLHRTLTHLDRPPTPVAPTVARFLWRMAALSGVAPTLSCCVDCRTTVNLTGFRYSPGGVVCESCRGRADRTLPEAGLKALRVVAGGQRAAWKTLPDAPSRPLVALAQGYLRCHFGDHLPQREAG